MAQQVPSNLGLMLIIGTLAMFIMALSIIVFAVLYSAKNASKEAGNDPDGTELQK